MIHALENWLGMDKFCSENYFASRAVQYQLFERNFIACIYRNSTRLKCRAVKCVYQVAEKNLIDTRGKTILHFSCLFWSLSTECLKSLVSRKEGRNIQLMQGSNNNKDYMFRLSVLVFSMPFWF